MSTTIKGTRKVRLSTTPGVYENPGAELAERVKFARASKPKLDYAAALLQVGRDDPELLVRYRQQFSQPRAPRTATPADDAGSFVARKIVELQATHGLTFAAAKKRAALEHPKEWAAYTTGL